MTILYWVHNVSGVTTHARRFSTGKDANKFLNEIKWMPWISHIKIRAS